MKVPKGMYRWTIPLYGGTIFFTTSPKVYRAAVRQFDEPDEEDLGGGRTLWVMPDSGLPIIIVGVFSGRMSTLSHELNHATLFILKHVGIDPHSSDGEPLCYLQAAMIDQFESRLT